MFDSPEYMKVYVISKHSTYQKFLKENMEQADTPEDFVYVNSPIKLRNLKKDQTLIILLEDCFEVREWNMMFPIIRYITKLKLHPIFRGRNNNGKWDFTQYKLV